MCVALLLLGGHILLCLQLSSFIRTICTRHKPIPEEVCGSLASFPDSPPHIHILEQGSLGMRLVDQCLDRCYDAFFVVVSLQFLLTDEQMETIDDMVRKSHPICLSQTLQQNEGPLFFLLFISFSSLSFHPPLPHISPLFLLPSPLPPRLPHPPPFFQVDSRSFLEELATDLPIHTLSRNGSVRYCEACMLIKPDRTHHCSLCNK